MIGSGTESDPWVPLDANDLKECWSIRGGFIDLTCDIDMSDMIMGEPIKSTSLNINGFSITIRKTNSSGRLLSSNDNYSKVYNGIIIFSPSNGVIGKTINFGSTGSLIENIILINNGGGFISVSYSLTGVRRNIVCINTIFNSNSMDQYSCIYQDVIFSGNYFKKGEAKPEDIDSVGLPKDIFYVENYLGGKNLSVERKGRSFVAGVTSVNGIAVRMELTVIGSKSSAKWTGYSDDSGKFSINLGNYSDPVSVFATDIINKKLRGNDIYSVGDVAIAYPDSGVKFICISAGSTGDLPNPLPQSGTVTIGTAVFEVKNISPSSCAGPMIPANKYSNYGIKPK